MLAFQVGFLEIGWKDILDITLVTVLLYNVYKLIRGSIALRVSIGFLSLYLLYLVVKASEMELLSSILGQFMSVGVLGALIIFQSEIRKFLLLIGKTTSLRDFTFFNFFNVNGTLDKNSFDITPIIDAMKTLGGTNTGALIVISKNEDLKFFVETGDVLDAQISKRILMSIFYKNSPLHDGAAIIHNSRIVAARCILPVSDNPNIPANLGLRHRAGIGISEAYDVVVLIVSEETGQLSFVRGGKISHNLSAIEIRQLLNEYISGNKVDKKKVIQAESNPKINPELGEGKVQNAG
ncbi:diadenylate cyclase CdaA [Flammeovirgaceae bacterium SG7u.111]|nr:diadenylate cyclase CdaA [Flammeovirgaceae bacterium SG7u.132]WPO35984.1 diadenylate cyclase CdaA [Flammeovirgaceae bacterium SG7u.111]